MEQTKIPTGSQPIDWLLEGGFEKGIVTTVYGPAGSGKTNLCMVSVACQSSGKILYVDTEGSFSVSRLKQLTDSYEKVLENVSILKPTSFQEQKQVFDELNERVDEDVSFIIIDSIAMLYRLELWKTKNPVETNRELGIQLASLIQLARNYDVPILMTNQVYADLEDKDTYNMAGGDILKYASKCIIEMTEEDDVRRAVLRKHRSLPEGKEVSFKIVDEGIVESDHSSMKSS